MNELQLLTKATKEDRYFNEHYEEIEKEYANEFVAIENGEIITHNKNIESLINDLERKDKNPATTFITFVYKKGSVIIL